MADVLIKDGELQELNAIIMKIPTEFGVPLLNFFSKVVNTRQQEFVRAQQQESEDPGVKNKTAEGDVTETGSGSINAN